MVDIRGNVQLCDPEVNYLKQRTSPGSIQAEMPESMNVREYVPSVVANVKPRRPSVEEALSWRLDVPSWGFRTLP